MLTLGDLVVYLGLDKKKFDAGLHQAENQARNFSSSTSSAITNAFSFATGNIVTGALTKITAGLGAIKETMIGGNTAFEQYKTQFDVLLGNADLAKERLQELAEFGARTPFELPDLTVADKILQSFGLHAPDVTERFEQMGIDVRTITGDMAAGANVSFQEIAKYIGRFSAGGVGEALERFSELGIVTRAELAAMGVEFSKSGELVSPLNEAFDTLLQLAQQKFGGMMEAQSQTFGGMLSNFWDWINSAGRILGEPIFDVFKNGLESFLELVKPGSPVNQVIEEFADTIRAAIDVAGTLLQTLVGGGLGATVESWATSLTEKLQQVTAFLGQLKDEIMGLTAGDILGQLGPGLQDLQDKMNKSLEDLSKRHNQTVAGIQNQLTNAADKLGQDLAAINEKYADKISDLQERITETAASFNERLADMAEQQAKKRAGLEEQLAKSIADGEEKLTELKAEHDRRRRELTANLMTAESEEAYLNIKAQLKSEDEKYQEQKSKAQESNAEQVSELKARLAEEDAEYAKQQARLEKQRDKALADLNEQLSKVEAEKAKETAAVQAGYDKQVALLNQKLEAEHKAYAENQQKIKAMYAQQMADFEASINQRAAAIGQGPAAAVGEWIRGVIEAFQQGGLLGVVDKIAQDLAGAAPRIQTALMGWASGFWNWLTGEGGALQGAGGQIDQLITTVSNFLLEKWPVIQAQLAVWNQRFWDWIIGPGGALERTGEVLNSLMTRIETWLAGDEARTKLNNLGAGLSTALMGGILLALQNTENTNQFLAGLGTLLLGVSAGLVEIYLKAGSQVAGGFMGGIVTYLTGKEPSESLVTTLGELWQRVIESVISTFFPVLNLKFATDLAADLNEKIAEIEWSTIGSNIVGGIRSGLESAWGELTAWLAEKAAQLPDWINNPLDAHSPARKLIPSGGNIVDGVKVGFEQGLPGLRQAIASGMQSLIPAQPAPGALAGAMGGTTNLYLSQTNNLPTAPAGFDSAGLLSKIEQQTNKLIARSLIEFYKRED